MRGKPSIVASIFIFFLTLTVPTCFAQYDRDGLFQFSRYWQQEPSDETSFELNLNPDSQIDYEDLLRLIEGWRYNLPTPTPGQPKEITIHLPGFPSNATPLEMVLIPAGTFMMGRYAGEQGSNSYEDPQHQVTISQDFYLGKYEVTKAQWTAVMGTTPWSGQSYVLNDSNSPAVYISWNDCQAFVNALNQLGQGTFRLPSEAEWEYACRAGTTTRFYFGDSDGCGTFCEDCAAGVLPGNRSDYMWYCGNNSPSGTKPVGGKLPNDFGLYDMHGNVWEWCEDDWHSGYANAPDTGAPWVDSPRGSARVVRGGYWDDYAQYCRSSFRGGYTPGDRGYGVGFRLVREAP